MELSKTKVIKRGRLSAETEEALLSQLEQLAGQGKTKEYIHKALNLKVNLFNKLYIKALEQGRINPIPHDEILPASKIPITLRVKLNATLSDMIAYKKTDEGLLLTVVANY